jgi:uncharacterized membrane protein SirB2
MRNAPVLIDRALLLPGKSMCWKRSPAIMPVQATGFISQIASVLEIALTMLALERKKTHAAFVFFLQLT